MARRRSGATTRYSRNWGIASGVTFVTSPSGVTIYKNRVDMADGYALPYATAQGKKMTAGVLDVSGGSIDRQGCGLTTIDNVIASASSKSVAGFTDVTGFAVTVYPMHGQPFGSATQVCFIPYKLNLAGVTYSGAVSVHYIAIGT